ncbi:MAG: M48 family metalloprotease [Magnetospirillum sp.]|nr:M48 family metalloprotease [Magnetospirillum sp.]
MFKRIILLATLFLALPASASFADDQPSFIRDAEIENTIRAYSTPLFQAAGLDPNAVSIHILVDPTLNAFVTGGQNLFLHTGLLLRAENASQVIGVIAHETGHMAGGHVVRMQGELGTASTEAIVAMLLGAAVGATSGRGDVGSALAMGGQSMVERDILAYSRENEAAADQAGLKFLDATHQSARGMLEFMEILGDQELLVTTEQDPYVRTHPLTRDRVVFIQDWVEHSKWSDQPIRPEYAEMFQRMQAKLYAFLEPPMRTLRRYRANDTSIAARYARAIAYYRKPDLTKALPLIDGLIAERPDDPYFPELKGQMLFENARGGEAVAPYRRAAQLLPGSALIRIELGQVEVEQNDPSLLKDAVTNLSAGVTSEPGNPDGWRLLGIAYGRAGNEGMASYALAEEALLEGRRADANYLAVKAERLLPRGGPIWLRIQDIKDRAAQRR